MIAPDYILLFENQYVLSLYPFFLFHMQWEVRCGYFRIFEKIQNFYPNAKLIFNSKREKTLELFLQKFKINSPKIQIGNLLVVNSGILPTIEFWNTLNNAYVQFINENKETKSVVFVAGQVPLVFYLSKDETINPIDFDANFFPILMEKYYSKLPKIEIPPPKVINFLWDAIEYNSLSIVEDFNFLKQKFNQLPSVGTNVHLINHENIIIGNNCKIYPNVVLDAESGPIIIGDNVTIHPNVFIQGPVAIGSGSLVKSNSHIYQGTTIGEVCKVAGEIENSIIHSFSNKQHHGFLGHSYISEWVNLGAGTTTSDLKNTYEPISVRIYNETFNTGRTFLGLICGDHTKTAINTTFNSGTITGICCNIYHSGLLPKFIPSFTWGGDRNNSTIGSIQQAINTARTMMLRRNKILTDIEIEIMKLEYESTKSKSKHIST